MMIPKRRLLTLIFACLCFKKSLLVKTLYEIHILIISETQTVNIMDCSPGQNNSGWCIAIISKGLSSLLLLGGSGGVDPIILKFECPKMRFPAFWALN